MREKPTIEVRNKLTESQIRDARIDEVAEEQRRIGEENLELRTMVIALRKKMADYDEILEIVESIKTEMEELNKKLTQINKSKNKA